MIPGQQQRHSSDRMTREYNRTAAFAKITMCPIEKLDERRVKSIANSHGLSISDVEQMIAERRAAL